MIIPSLLLAFRFHLPHFISHQQQPPPRVVCVSVVGYEFSGRPGTRFLYGEEYTIPAEGKILIIATPELTAYQVGYKVLPLDVFPLDEFGFRPVRVP